MFTASAEFYDLIYSTIKDYVREVERITELLRRLNPSCRTVLDVACGTGEHARLLAAQGFVVDGIDLDAAFLRISEKKHPAGRFFEADMRSFHLPHRYDAVLCLFSSIGYVRTLDGVREALSCFREHVTPDGVIVVEPWLTPDVFDPTRVSQAAGEANGLRVTRVSRSEVAGSLSRLYFDYEITDSSGTRQASEIHELGLFTVAEMLGAFEQAGLHADYDPVGLMDRGLYTAGILPQNQTSTA